MTRDIGAAGGEFAAWLRRGLGRPAVRWQDNTPTAAEHEALLHACTHELRYDVQCENGRAGYLWTLIGLSGDPGRYRDHLVRALARPEAGPRPLDRILAFELLCRFAGTGDHAARGALRAFFDAGDPGTLVECDEALIGLDGIDALVLVAERFADTYAAEPWRISGLVEALCARDGRDAGMRAIVTAETAHPSVARLIARWRARQDDVAEPVVQSVERSYAGLKARLDDIRVVPRGWIDAARDTDLEAVARELMTETDAERLGKYLGIFHWRTFPGPPRRLIDLTRADDRWLARRAWRALSRVRAPEVRALALQLIAEGEWPREGIRLLASNYQPGDLRLIHTRLAASPGKDVCHGVETGLLTLLDDGTAPVAEAVESLLWLYDNGPCSVCREDVVGHLAQLERVPGWMGREIAFDANPEVAKYQPPA